MGVNREPSAVRQAMKRAETMLPGLGAPVALQVRDGSPAAGRSLAQLNLRGRTGATVLAIVRAGEQVLVPRGADVVRVDDVLAVAGTADAVSAARDEIEGNGSGAHGG
jgi:monovalent cation:H+ antiporter-2, CPA2 family